MLRKILNAACLVPLAMGLCQCDMLKAKGPSPYASTLLMKFTPMAQAAMAREKDSFVVVAYYYGDPTPQAASKADDLGRLVLGEERVGWSADTRRVHLDGNIDTSLLPEIRGEPQLMIGIHSLTPIGGPDDLIDCKTWVGTVKMAQAQPPVLGCQLETGDTVDKDDLSKS